jgi:hypothetical protein
MHSGETEFDRRRIQYRDDPETARMDRFLERAFAMGQ